MPKPLLSHPKATLHLKNDDTFQFVGEANTLINNIQLIS